MDIVGRIMQGIRLRRARLAAQAVIVAGGENKELFPTVLGENDRFDHRRLEDFTRGAVHVGECVLLHRAAPAFYVK